MHTAKVKLKSSSPYSQRKHYDVPKLDKELHKDYEARTWRERMHTKKDGTVFMPPTSVKNCLSEAAKYLSLSIPGKGKQTYTKHFEAGVSVIDQIIITDWSGNQFTKDAVEGEWMFVPSDGVKGGGKRVDKCFPVIHEWKAEFDIHVLDDTITEEVFKDVLIEAGRLIGLGSFRPRNGGYYGRFEVESVKWQ